MCLLYIVTIAMNTVKGMTDSVAKKLSEGQTMLENGAKNSATVLTDVAGTSLKKAEKAATTAVDAAAKITPEVVKNKLAGNTSFWERLMAVPGSVSRTFKKTLGLAGGNRTRRGREFHGGKRKSRNMRKKKRSTKKK